MTDTRPIREGLRPSASPRMRELRAEGEAMNRDQASAYAGIHIAEYLVPPSHEAT
jgi:hypothetical protein